MNNDLNSFSDKELKMELERRAELKMPKPLEGIDWRPVIDAAKDYLEFCASEDWHDDTDDAMFMFENVMQTIYGKNIWDWINEVTN